MTTTCTCLALNFWSIQTQIKSKQNQTLPSQKTPRLTHTDTESLCVTQSYDLSHHEEEEDHHHNSNSQTHKTHFPNHLPNPPLTSFLCKFIKSQTSTPSSHFAPPFSSTAPMATRQHGPLPPLRSQHLHRLRVGHRRCWPFCLQPHKLWPDSVGPSRQRLGLFTRYTHD